MRAAALFACVAALCQIFVSVPADARPWKPTPASLAEDYAIISDTRSDNDLVMVFWLVPQMYPTLPQAQALLDKYIVVAVIHAHRGALGGAVFDTVDTLEAKDGNGKPLKLLTGADLPPDVAQSVTAFGGVMQQLLGPMGQGMSFFVFNKGSVHACEKGQLVIPYAGETYTYDTPIPGCPAK